MDAPIVCFNCGQRIGSKLAKLLEAEKLHKTRKELLDEMGLMSYCCRTAITSAYGPDSIITKYINYIHQPAAGGEIISLTGLTRMP